MEIDLDPTTYFAVIMTSIFILGITCALVGVDVINWIDKRWSE